VREGRAIERKQWQGVSAGDVTSFGVDGAGELYVVNGGGKLLKLVRARRAGG